MTDSPDVSTVSFLLPVYNEAATLAATLESIAAQRYPSDRMEIVIALAPSTDASETLIQQFCDRHPELAVRTIVNPTGNTSQGRNLCLEVASGQLVMNFSGHAVAAPHLLETLTTQLEALPDDVVGIGCGIRPRSEANWTARAIATVMASPLGGGGAADSNYNAKQDGPARSVAFTLYRTHVLRRLGGFDEDFWCGQDAELNIRLARHGHSIWFTPDTYVEHFKRARVGDFVKQMWRYGIARARLTKKHPQSFRVVYLLPVGFTLLVALFAVAAYQAWVSEYLVGGIVSVFCLASFASAIVAGGGIVTVVVSPLLYALLHFSYGLGFLRGLLPRRIAR